jgi:hypothetical protein
MLVLFDQGTPKGIASALKAHTVRTAKRQGWDRLRNGALLREAEAAGFDVLLTPDKNIRYQQNLDGREIAIVALGNSQWPTVRLHLQEIADAVNAATPGSYTLVDIPFAR